MGFNYNGVSVSSGTLNSSLNSAQNLGNINFKTNVESGSVSQTLSAANTSTFSAVNQEPESMPLTANTNVIIESGFDSPYKSVEDSNSLEAGLSEVSVADPSPTQENDFTPPPVPQVPMKDSSYEEYRRQEEENRLNEERARGILGGFGSVVNVGMSIFEGIGRGFEGLVDSVQLIVGGGGSIVMGVTLDAFDYIFEGKTGFENTKELLQGVLDIVGEDHVKDWFSELYEYSDFLKEMDAGAWLKKDGIVCKGIDSISYYALQAVIAYFTGGLGEAANIPFIAEHAFTIVSALMTYAEAFPDSYDMVKDIKTQDLIDDAIKSGEIKLTEADIQAELELLMNDPRYSHHPPTRSDAEMSLAIKTYEKLEIEARKSAEDDWDAIIDAWGWAVAETGIDAMFTELANKLKDKIGDVTGLKDTIIKSIKVSALRQVKTFIKDMLEAFMDGKMTFEEATQAILDYVFSVVGNIIGDMTTYGIDSLIAKYGFFDSSKLEAIANIEGAATLDGTQTGESSIEAIFKSLYAQLKDMKIDPSTMTGKEAKEIITKICPNVDGWFIDSPEAGSDEFYKSLLDIIMSYGATLSGN